ncbi:hypothetical protein NPX13_g11104 [Xylaria arbuscula]|uniref:Uncharacterized protein n=1 Tax=Xylaria arbuscula TaxID=114810 RepID=A0A9W8TH91_9PEZI|nr:hypothetical protein NPX13_g11104 [Xylaria arbuscula]
MPIVSFKPIHNSYEAMGCTMSKATIKRHAEDGPQVCGPRKVQKLQKAQTATTKKKKEKTVVEPEVKAEDEKLVLTPREMMAILNTPLRPRPAPMPPREYTYGDGIKQSDDRATPPRNAEFTTRRGGPTITEGSLPTLGSPTADAHLYIIAHTSTSMPASPVTFLIVAAAAAAVVVTTTLGTLP